MLTVLSVAYPLAPVGPNAVGGAEQILSLLDAALVAAGHQSLVVACAGSRAEGQLFTIPLPGGPFDHEALREVHCRYQALLQELLDRWPVDLVHMHGLDFDQYLPAPGVPVLATLHLPPPWYAPEIFYLVRSQTYLHCVSRTQQDSCPISSLLLPPIENGVPVDRLSLPDGQQGTKRNFALILGRVCPEKGFHLAMDAAIQAGMPLLMAGQVFPYLAHEAYFREEIQPRLEQARQSRHHIRFIGPVSFSRKRLLLAAARCLLIPSLAPETSSLVAMEALACGTPVIAFPAGALPEIVEDGKTGFLVENVTEMAMALRKVERLEPEICRRMALERFSAGKMVKKYFELYSALANGEEPQYAYHTISAPR